MSAHLHVLMNLFSKLRKICKMQCLMSNIYISCFATRLINSIIQEHEYLVCLSFDTQIILKFFFFLV